MLYIVQRLWLLVFLWMCDSHRISDGFFLSSDVVNSDERYHLEPDNDDEWQRNLCSEPREYQSRRQPDISQSTFLQIPIFGFILLSASNGIILVQQQGSVSTVALLLLLSTVVLYRYQRFSWGSRLYETIWAHHVAYVPRLTHRAFSFKVGWRFKCTVVKPSGEGTLWNRREGITLL